MFRVLDVGEDGVARESTGIEGVAPPPAGALRWIDVSAQDEAQLALLRERFGFHPLALEDCAHFDQRPKLEEYGDYLFLVMHGFVCPAGDPTHVEVRELHAFLGAGYLVTVHDAPVAPLEQVWSRVAGDPLLAKRGMDFVYYLVVDAMVDANFPILDLIAQELDDLEDAILAGADRRDLTRMFQLKRVLVTMRRNLSPQRDLFGLLSKRGDARIGERTALYFRDVYDHLVRIYEAIDTGRDLLANSFDAYLSMVSNRTNDIMRRLTLFSVIFLPLTFITGFFGQNFAHLPFDSWVLMLATIVACVAVPVGMLVWFRKSDWI